MTPKIFEKNIFIPFHLGDPAGVIFFSHVFFLAHESCESFIMQQGIEWSNWFENPVWAVPIKNAQADYKRPIKAGSTCLIKVKLAEIDDTSLVIHSDFYQENTLCCSVQTKHVFVSKLTQKKTFIPDSIRSLLIY